MHFRRKLTIVFVLFSLLPVGIAVMMLRESARVVAKDRAEKDLKRSMQVLRQAILMQFNAIQDAISTALADPLYRSQVGKTIHGNIDKNLGLGGRETDQTDAVEEVHQVFSSANLPIFSRYPIFALVNADGRVLFTKGNSSEFGKRVVDVPVVQRTLAQGTALDLWGGRDASLQSVGFLPRKGQDDIYLVMGHAIASGGAIIGMAIVGQAISHKLITQFERSSLSRVALATNTGQVLVAYDAPADLERALGDSKGFLLASKSVIKEVRLDRQAHLAMGIDLHGLTDQEKIGRAFLFRSFDEDVKAVAKRINSALVVILVLSVAISLFSARFMVQWL